MGKTELAAIMLGLIAFIHTTFDLSPVMKQVVSVVVVAVFATPFMLVELGLVPEIAPVLAAVLEVCAFILSLLGYYKLTPIAVKTALAAARGDYHASFR